MDHVFSLLWFSTGLFSHILQVSSVASASESTLNDMGKWNCSFTHIKHTKIKQNKALYTLHWTYCNKISEATTYAPSAVTNYTYDNVTRRRVCSWGFKDLTPNSPDPVCYRAMEAATFEEAQRTCRGMFADMLTLPDERHSIDGEFGLEWEILCEVGLNQSEFGHRGEFHPIKTIQR